MSKSYPHIERYIRSTPWAIVAGTLEAMIEALALSKAGVELTREELEERVADGAGRGSAQRVGSVAVLPIFGVIMPRSTLFSDVSGGTSLESFRTELADAVADDDVKAVVLDVNSPGGSTELLTETAAELRAARETKPIVAVANTLAASAAYHLGASASELFATPSGYAGSIGVYSAHDDLSGAQEKAGVKTTLIHAGKYKVEGNPFEELSAEARREAQRKVDAAFDLMVSDIAAGRRVDESAVRNGYGQGRVLDAKTAYREGMIDGVQTFDATLGALLASGESGHAPAVAAASSRPVVIGGDPSRLAAALGSVTIPGSPITAESLNSTTITNSLTADLDAGLAFVDGLVASAERLASVRGGKREQIEELALRLVEVLDRTEPAKAGVNLEAETTAAIAAARLAGT